MCVLDFKTKRNDHPAVASQDDERKRGFALPARSNQGEHEEDRAKEHDGDVPEARKGRVVGCGRALAVDALRLCALAVNAGRLLRNSEGRPGNAGGVRAPVLGARLAIVGPRAGDRCPLGWKGGTRDNVVLLEPPGRRRGGHRGDRDQRQNREAGRRRAIHLLVSFSLCLCAFALGTSSSRSMARKARYENDA